jgi:hypothetical protein
MTSHIRCPEQFFGEVVISSSEDAVIAVEYCEEEIKQLVFTSFIHSFIHSVIHSFVYTIQLVLLSQPKCLRIRFH